MCISVILFLPYAVDEWNKLDPETRAKPYISRLKEALLNFIRPQASSVFSIVDCEGLKLLTRLRVNLSHLKEHKYRHNFADTFNPICNCGLLEIESTSHYLLRCLFYSSLRIILLNEIAAIYGDMSNLSDGQKNSLVSLWRQKT